MKRRAKPDSAAAKKPHNKANKAALQAQRDAERQQRRQLLPVLLAHEQEEEQRLLQAIQHKWKKLEQRYDDAGDGASKPLVRRLSIGAVSTAGSSGAIGESGGGMSGGGMYSPSSPFYFTHFSSYAHHASRVGPRYQSVIQPLLTPQQRSAASEAERFPEHSTPLSSPAAFATAAASAEYGRRHFSSPPSFPAFSHVLSSLLSPQLLAYRREQFAIRERVKEEKRYGSVRLGGRGRRSTRITPAIAGGRAAESGAGGAAGDKRKRDASKREERGVDSVPLVWERMLNERGEPTGGGGRERMKQLIDGIGQWRRQQRLERHTNTAAATAPSSLSALPAPVARTALPSTAAALAGGSGVGVVGAQKSVSSLATLPLTKDKDEKGAASSKKRRTEAFDTTEERRKRSKLQAAARQSQSVT